MNVYGKILISALLIAFLNSTSIAQEQPAWAEVMPDIKGNPVAGREKAKSCDVCHGEEGFSEHRYYPVLAGQKNKYLVFQLHRYRNSKRAHPLMTPLTQGLSE